MIHCRSGTSLKIRVLRLCSVSVVKKAQSENAVFSIARTRCRETQCSLFPIYCRLPKLAFIPKMPADLAS